MNWHILTSSKGGVGKTLLSLMLWVAHLKAGKKVLLVELNGMNPDLYRFTAFTEYTYNQPTRAFNLDDDREFPELPVFKCQNVEWQGYEYVILWPADPYDMLCGHENFSKFIDALYQKIQNEKLCNGFVPESIIIDTNFHFGNIFTDEVEKYKEYGVFNDTSQNFKIWFLWVFKQIHSLINMDVDTGKKIDDNHFGLGRSVLMQMAKALESQDDGTKPLPCSSDSSLVHVFNTPTLIKPCSPGWFRGDIASEATEVLQKFIDKQHNSASCIRFDKLVLDIERLAKEVIDEGVNLDENDEADIHDLFLRILGKFADNLRICHKNIITIPEHVPALLNYTDKIYFADEIFQKIEEEQLLLDKFSNSLRTSGIL
ncbi:hypothetical protein QUF74_03755 [Candidatus Halobeggiatoa sp. HSG11]|nr:hypothetical protein [Candidatus Halobeggiatoa sp. HSG11]